MKLINYAKSTSTNDSRVRKTYAVPTRIAQTAKEVDSRSSTRIIHGCQQEGEVGAALFCTDDPQNNRSESIFIIFLRARAGGRCRQVGRCTLLTTAESYRLNILFFHYGRLPPFSQYSNTSMMIGLNDGYRAIVEIVPKECACW